LSSLCEVIVSLSLKSLSTIIFCFLLVKSVNHWSWHYFLSEVILRVGGGPTGVLTAVAAAAAGVFSPDGFQTRGGAAFY